MLVATGLGAAVLADDDSDTPAFSFGGRKLPIKRNWVFEPYAKEVDKPTAVEPVAAPELLEPPTIAGGLFAPAGDPPETVQPALPEARRADRIPSQVADDAPTAVPPGRGKPRTVAPTSGTEPELMAGASPAPIVIYHPLSLPESTRPTNGPSGESSWANSIALLAAGFAAGVALVLALTAVPVAIALRRQWLTPPSATPGTSFASNRSSASESALPSNSIDVATTKSPEVVDPPHESLEERLSRDRAAQQQQAERQAAALFTHVLQDNLALQNQLRRRDEIT